MIDPTIAKAVNTIVMLAAPVDRPVLNVDVYFEAYYRKIDQFWSANRHETFEANNETDICCRNGQYANDKLDVARPVQKPNQLLNDLLLVTIGGGEQDLMVHAGLTSSKYSDLHAMVSVKCI